MKIKEGLEISSSDFWYDLSSGGYINPYEICSLEVDADRIKEAIKIINDFHQSCVDQIEGFEQ